MELKVVQMVVTYQQALKALRLQAAYSPKKQMKTPNCCTSCGNAWEAEGSEPSFLTTVPPEPPAPGRFKGRGGSLLGSKCSARHDF